MPLDDRDYIKGSHPPNCTCVDCTNKRLKRLRKEAHPNYISTCPRCGKKSLWHNVKEQKYECLNLECKAVMSSPGTIEAGKAGKRISQKTYGGHKIKIQTWLIALLLIFALSVVGLGISMFAGSFIPFWLMFGFSLTYSIEKWLHYFTRKYKAAGKLYRLLLNFSILSLLGLLVWSGVKLFSQQFVQSSIIGSLMFIAEFAFFIWMWQVVSKNSWRWPSMKLTVFSLICLSVIFAFAGVQPMEGYKDKIVSFFSSIASSSSEPMVSSPAQTTPPITTSPSTHEETSTPEPPAISQYDTPLPEQSPDRTVTTQPPISPPDTIIPGEASSIDRSRFQTIDEHVLGTPESAEKSIDSLAAYLIQPARNDFEKARAIYRWITQNISYDFSAYLTKSYSSTRATDVLVNRSSVCQGYSALFNALAESAGLEVVTISGWAKGYSYNAGDQITGPTNHAWNTVKIDGGWYLIDSTWGAGSITQQRFVRKFDEGYFLTPPERFIYNHLPENSKWQLLSAPVSKSEFSALPYIHSNFFLYGIDLGDNTQSVINTEGRLTMTFTVPSNTYLMAELSQGNIELPDRFISARRSGNQYRINATFPDPGTYILSIYARKDSQYGMYDGVLEYKVLVGSTP